MSRAPHAKLQAYKQRMGWSFLWASSFDSEFTMTSGYRTRRSSGSGESSTTTSARGPCQRPASTLPWLHEGASSVGTDWPTYGQEGPGMSAFALEDGVVYTPIRPRSGASTLSGGMYPWRDRAPLGRNETGIWWRRHDEYDNQ